MLPGSIVAGILLLYLTTFFLVNLQNVIKGSRTRRRKKTHAEVERPRGLMMSIAAMGTLAFFAEALMVVYAGLTGQIYQFIPFLQLEVPMGSSVQILGIAVMGAGFVIFVWSVIARGRYSVSWEMADDHALITSGPYRFVRHPSYLGYFLMFSGFLLTWLNLVALIPLVAVPGYAQIVVTEEELLRQRFGEEYIRYMESTGRFIPKCS
jgi:protein-S-isoprenylcysteine O-methyltransferase Ste14